MRLVRLFCAMGVAVALLVPLSAHAQSQPQPEVKPGRTEAISVNDAGQYGNASSGDTSDGLGTEACVFDENSVEAPAVSDDGRFIAFTSYASNLDRRDSNGTFLSDVFLRDRKRGTTRIISVDPLTGLVPPVPSIPVAGPCFAWSRNPVISGNGRFVAFQSRHPLVGAVPTNPIRLLPYWQVYVYDNKTGNIDLISKNAKGDPASGDSGINAMGISQNGNRIVFTSRARDLMPDQSACPQQLESVTRCNYQVYLRDRTSDKTTLVSRTSAGDQSNGQAWNPSISDDGKVVAFESSAANLFPDGIPRLCMSVPPVCPNVYVHEIASARTELVSVNRDGGPGSSHSLLPPFSAQVLSADGRFVVFYGGSIDLVPNHGMDTRGGAYVRDRKLQRTFRATVSSAGEKAAGGYSSISDDGRLVLSNMADGPPGAAPSSSVVLHDLATGQTDLLINGMHERTGGSPAYWTTVLSGDGLRLAWVSQQDWHEEDTNGMSDLFLRDLQVRGLGVGAVETSDRHGRGISPSLVKASKDAVGDAVLQGADLIGGRIAERPSLRDFYLRLEVKKLSTTAGLPDPSLSYRFIIKTRGGTRFVVEADPEPTAPLAGGSLTLRRCDRFGGCTMIGDLEGGWGTTGEAIVVAVPQRLLGDTPLRMSDIESVEMHSLLRSGTGTSLDILNLF